MSELVLIILGIALLLGLTMVALSPSVKPRGKGLDKQLVQKRWDKVRQMADEAGHARSSAIVEADKLLDYVLKARGYEGETMGERLKSAGRDLSFVDDVWEAHKLRNKLVHETEYEADRRLIDRSIKQFRQALKDLGAL